MGVFQKNDVFFWVMVWQAAELYSGGGPCLSPGRSEGPLGAEERAKLDARVVRMFKQHRRLTHQRLVELLQRQPANPASPTVLEHPLQYKPWQPEAVKSCLEGLISKEYIIRDESDRWAIVYLLPELPLFVLRLFVIQFLKFATTLCGAETFTAMFHEAGPQATLLLL